MIGVLATQQQELAGKYRPYPEYKDSGITRLGAIPSHWQPKKLKRMASIENGRDYKHVEATEGFPVIGSGGQFTWSEQYLYSGESVLLGRKGTVDKPLYINGSFWTVDTMFYTKVGKTIPAKFLYYAALTIEFGLYSTNTALPSMTQEDLGNIHFGSPSYGEAENIAAFLDYETSRIDRLIAQQQRLIELLKEKRQTVISHAVTKGLNPNAPMKDSGVEWLGQVPEHWQIQKTAWHFTAQKGRNGQMLTKEYCGENSGDYPVYSGQTENNGIMGRIDSFEFDFGNDGCLFSTTVGAKAMSLSLLKGKFSLSQNCMVIIPRENNAFSVSFAFYHFQPLFSYERGLIPEHMQASFRMDDLYQYSIAMPPVSEQIEISDFINGEVIKIDYLVQIAEKAITLMQERRSALISAAVTGKIDLRGWTQPAEEVAA